MGHNTGKDIYRQLGRKIDGLTMRAPCNDALYSILKELYSANDAELIVKMPYGFAILERLVKVTGIARPQLERQLESLCPRGLVIDICIGGEYYYTPLGVRGFSMP